MILQSQLAFKRLRPKPFSFRSCPRFDNALIQGDVPWCMLFAKVIALVDEIRDGIHANLEQGRQELDSRGLKLIQSKTKYIECNF